MIFLGLIHFGNNDAKLNHKMYSVLSSYLPNDVSTVEYPLFHVCYGKLSQNDTDIVLEDSHSILIGRVFDKENSCSVTSSDLAKYSHSAPLDLLNKIWGHYVYLTSNTTDKTCKIFIDPISQLSLFYYTLPNGHVLFASDIELLIKSSERNFQLNWDYLFSYIVSGNNHVCQTPLHDIYELPPSCVLELAISKKETSPFWTPFKKSDNVNISQRPVESLESTISALIAPYQNICLSLSGGLDSSALAYCIKQVKKDDQALIAYNFFHKNVNSSNELYYARQVCDEVGIQLIEIESSQCMPFDQPQSKLPLASNKPFPGLVSLRWQEHISESMRFNTPSIFLSGHGSDHIFMCPPTKNTLIDCITDKGLDAYINKMKNIAHIYRTSILYIIKENIQNYFDYFIINRTKKGPVGNYNGILPKWFSHSRTMEDLIHPVYKNHTRFVLPGKHEQIDALYEAYNSIHLNANKSQLTHYPFLYRPVVECALNFNTYDLFDKGYDRYPLRLDISQTFHTNTVWRKGKSETTGIYQLGLKKNLSYVLEMCIEGYCSKQGIIEKELLRSNIISISSGTMENAIYFVRLAAIEIMLKQWEEKSLL